MAHIGQLMIRGVRSVGIEEEDAHIIKFLNPLTIISGPNGTGKTTIIESLNYVTTGELPAGKLATFIHNLKISRRSRVDSMVKLQFFDAKNRECVATKRMTSSLTKGEKFKTESEEFTIQINNNGVVRKISSKVADFRREMLNLLGIPTAILDSVVFCHQEDSCWPLSEPRELKKRFDKIFQLTKFVKALDQMKKLKKEYDNELKIVTEKKHNAEMVIQNKARFLQDIADTERWKADALIKLQTLRKRIEECTDFIRQNNEKLIHLEKVRRTLDLKKAELNMRQEQLRNINVAPYKGSSEMLQLEIDELTSSAEFKNLSDKKNNLEREVANLQSRIEQLKAFRRAKEEELVELRSADMHRASLMKELGALEKLLAETYDLRAGVDLDAQFEALINSEKNERENLKNNVLIVKNECEKQLEAALADYNKMEFEHSTINSSIRKLETDIRQFEVRLQAANSSQSAIANLNSEISLLESKLSDLPPGDENEADRIRQERQLQQDKLTDLRNKLRSSEIFEESEKELSRKQEEHAVIKIKLDDLEYKHKPAFINFFGSFSSGPWSQKVTSYQNDNSIEQSVAENALNRAQLSADREQQNLSQIDNSERKLTDELNELRSKILNTSGCLPDDVSAELIHVKSSLKKSRNELAPLDTKAILYESWSNEVTQKSCCPLCERRFTNKNAAHDLSTKLMNMSLNFPEEIGKLQNEVSIYEEKENILSLAVSDVDRVKKIEAELTELAERRSESERSLLIESAGVKDRKRELDKIREKTKMLSEIQIDVGLMDNYLESLERLSSEIKVLKAQIPPSQAYSCSLLKENISELEGIINNLVKRGEHLQIASNERNAIGDRLNSLRERRVTLGEAAAQSTMIIEQLESKKAEKNALLKKQCLLSSDLPSFQKVVEAAKVKKEDVLNSAREEELRILRKLNEMTSHKTKLDDLVQKLTTLSVNKNEVGRCTEELKKTDDEILNKNMMIDRLQNQVGDMDSMHLRKRTLEDQKSRMILENSIQNIEKELIHLDIGVEDPEVLRREVTLRNNEREKAEIEKGRIDGQLGETEKKRREAEIALSGKNMKDAEKNYRDIIVDKVVCSKTIEDLDKYGKCLDSSILKFHTEKMSAINEILDDLWRRVYKGGDIESIKIRSDVASTDTRKSYDYKVVMLVEGGVEMDMRDRCSAGQKMLACILIRIALADVFGGICSMIALDEPTTNLDVHKVEYLADMLNDLIAARRNDDENGSTRGRQFQMIVITHDERLVEKLTLGTRPDFHYVLGKDARGLSYIRRKYPDGRTESTTQ